MLRTRVAILALPMILVSFLIATSRFYHIADVLIYLIPLFLLCSGLMELEERTVFKSVVKLHQDARVLEHLKIHHNLLSNFMD